MLLREVGRLREVSFRAHAMGTGRVRDLDAFDGWYDQILVWDKVQGAVVAGCRLISVAKVWRQRGPAGLYTATLFRIGERFSTWAHPALEVGRWFICPNRPDAAALLALLWRAIGQRVIAEPGCYRLLGAVSISAAYQLASRNLMARWLLAVRRHASPAAWADARHPYGAEIGGLRGRQPANLAALVRRVRELESDGKGPPALLRHYLALRSKLCGLGSDPNFGGCLDALTLVDFAQAPQSTPAGYFRGSELSQVRRRA